MPPVLGTWSLNPWTAREVHGEDLLKLLNAVASSKSSIPDTSALLDASDLFKPSFRNSLLQFPWHSLPFYLL